MLESNHSASEDLLIGLDIGGTKTAAGVLRSIDATAIIHVQSPSVLDQAESLFDAVVSIIESLLASLNNLRENVTSVGVSVAELVALDGSIISGVTLPWQQFPVRTRLSERIGLPVCVVADCYAGAFAETLLGIAQNRSSALYITVGTGIGVALIKDGIVWIGSHGMTATFATSARTVVGADDQLQVMRPLEEFASGPALVRRYKLLHPDFQGTAVDLVQRSRDGESAATQIVSTAGAALGASIADLINLLDPEIVIVGGGLGVAPGPYRDAVEASCRRHIWSAALRDIPIVTSGLGADSSWIGAALLGGKKPINQSMIP